MGKYAYDLCRNAFDVPGYKKRFRAVSFAPNGLWHDFGKPPLSSAIDQMIGTELVEGGLSMLFRLGISTEIFPLLIFIAVGAMCDFAPLISNPKVFLFGLTAQMGIFLTMGLAMILGFDVFEAAIGIMGAADGSHIDLCFIAFRTAPAGSYIRSRVYIHGIGPSYSAARNNGHHNKKRTNDQDATFL